jgi:hypothetical protein
VHHEVILKTRPRRFRPFLGLFGGAAQTVEFCPVEYAAGQRYDGLRVETRGDGEFIGEITSEWTGRT